MSKSEPTLYDLGLKDCKDFEIKEKKKMPEDFKIIKAKDIKRIQEEHAILRKAELKRAARITYIEKKREIMASILKKQKEGHNNMLIPRIELNRELKNELRDRGYHCEKYNRERTMGKCVKKVVKECTDYLVGWDVGR